MTFIYFWVSEGMINILEPFYLKRFFFYFVIVFAVRLGGVMLNIHVQVAVDEYQSYFELFGLFFAFAGTFMAILKVSTGITALPYRSGNLWSPLVNCPTCNNIVL